MSIARTALASSFMRVAFIGVLHKFESSRLCNCDTAFQRNQVLFVPAAAIAANVLLDAARGSRIDGGTGWLLLNAADRHRWIFVWPNEPPGGNQVTAAFCTADHVVAKVALAEVALGSTTVVLAQRCRGIL